jgi:hypothetical protein
VSELLADLAPEDRIRTRPSAAFLRWRYGLDLLGYRVLTLSDDPRHGLVVFRLRRRSAATEATICDVLTPGGHERSARGLLRLVIDSCDADYFVKAGGGLPLERAGFVALPRQGPRIFAMALTPGLDVGSLRRWNLSLGDVELL